MIKRSTLKKIATQANPGCPAGLRFSAGSLGADDSGDQPRPRWNVAKFQAQFTITSRRFLKPIRK
jgi:hypothetical protein